MLLESEVMRRINVTITDEMFENLGLYMTGYVVTNAQGNHEPATVEGITVEILRDYLKMPRNRKRVEVEAHRRYLEDVLERPE